VATVVTVHGTYAHTAGTADALNIGSAGEPQWWEKGSALEADLKSMVAGQSTPLEIVPFSWSGHNSELERRKAGADLLKVLRGLEQKGEPYCVVGHSHGGSVIAAALLDSVSWSKPLTHLKKWITVGTPFVGMRKERFLFTRLTLPRKVLFVASLMLFVMFLFYVAGELVGDHGFARHDRHYIGLLFSAAMTIAPFIFFYSVFSYLDSRELAGYARGTAQKMRDAYADKWLPLCHKDDEAVHGLKYLPKVRMHLIDDEFAAPTITKAAILVLPLAYLLIVTSPTIMLGISDFLQTHVYGVQEFARADDPVVKARDELREMASRMRNARDRAEQSSLEPAAQEDARRQAEQLRNQLRERRNQIEEAFPEITQVDRARRFKRRFLEKNGQPCEGGRLCGAGHDYALNSKLLYHVVTDELTTAVVDEDQLGGALGGLVRLLVPIVLVPAVFAMLALGVLAVIQFVARYLSAIFGRMLNGITLAEIKRSSFGNDTEGEVVVGSDYGPSWLDPVTCILPTEVSDEISAHSNQVTAQSLAKFRNAISTLAFSEGEDTKAGVISNYLSWKELVHTCYFDVSEFRKIIAQAISRAEGFAATEEFKEDGDYDRTGRWLADLGRKKTTETAAATGPEAPAAVAMPA
jgi:hypothetical protein